MPVCIIFVKAISHLLQPLQTFDANFRPYTISGLSAQLTARCIA